MRKRKPPSLNALFGFHYARGEERKAARSGRRCKQCHKPLKSERSTKRFCSTRCRVAFHRMTPERKRKVRETRMIARWHERLLNRMAVLARKEVRKYLKTLPPEYRRSAYYTANGGLHDELRLDTVFSMEQIERLLYAELGSDQFEAIREQAYNEIGGPPFPPEKIKTLVDEDEVRESFTKRIDKKFKDVKDVK